MSENKTTLPPSPTTTPPPPVPPPSTDVTLTVDGREITVPKGTNVLEAAKKLGIDISFFCYHPGLSIAASCRQCLVEIEGQPKLAPSCQVVAMPNMKVKSDSSPRALLARQQQLEFTLVNHPVDCPICDKAGECVLQKLYFEWDAKNSRVDIEKVHKPKKVDLGPTIVLDQERCILCSRCIRVCDEVAGVHQLEMAHRGDREILTTPPGAQLDNPYSLNTVDVCPVGALTSKDFRFTMRAWELYTTDSVCNGCATGCNVEIHHRERRIYRLVPRENLAVNQYWMCDEGRLTYKDVHVERLAGPFLDGLPTTWDKGIAAAEAALKPLLDEQRDKVGVVLSAGHTNEDNVLLYRLASEFLGITHIYAVGKTPVPERADKRLRVADVNPNWAGVKAIAPDAKDDAALRADLSGGALKGLIVLGADLPADLAGLDALDALVVIAAHDRGPVSAATVSLAAADWAEVDGTITNKDGRTQRLRAAFPPAGQSLPAWQVVVRLARKLGAANLTEYSSAKMIWKDLVQRGAPFAGSEWGRELPVLQLRFAGSRG